MKRLRVSCGSSMGHDPVSSQAACDLGMLLAQQGFSIVFGGGKIGLMGILADTAPV